ncbi:exopolysaccharide biosynthesis polyprenyl glycosylphosphotransferase [Pseudoalteromonas luteoviolacea]|uniref:exopolysaccharide biosynthesis polyprenyl glycosylphosphotransferase n=1 Tax=Pseudoalteromonas luteoviolacea TaxID=43657 RepID=UPI001EED322B|nr:exopolysaccharide biosynthesis polyprenyl glycosylphosphotransferase [Pseudoalteromonas luteoviolacea]MCF6439068.1 exopolysaccharide biosynthesis polyprenyl glycosylphosphotransferase [Pseudoalteromonas luteoviolacea]
MIETLPDHSKAKPVKVRKRLKSQSQALKQKSIYVFCPQDKVAFLEKLFQKYDFDAEFNNYDLDCFGKKVVCHYGLEYLDEDSREFLVRATEFGAWVEPLISYLDERLGYTEVQLLGSNYFLHQKAFSILSERRNLNLKRTFDIFSALIILLLTLPIMLITALIIKLESPGRILYKQKRVGLYNEEFEVVKFRSMRSDAEANGAQWAKKNDARVTKVGKFIRKTRIDELPQLINVLKGEMSLVGPRPERDVFVTELEKEIPYYRFRHAVKPGVTGLAQVSYPYGASVEDAIWKHKYDVYYIKHYSALLDIKIVFKTISTVLLGKGN